jgi:hypothetical protein
MADATTSAAAATAAAPPKAVAGQPAATVAGPPATVAGPGGGDAHAGVSHVTGDRFTFANLPAPWMVPLVLVVAIAFAWWGWRRYGPAPKGFAGTLARTCRALALALLVLAVAGPAWRRTTVTDLPYRIVVAVDRSASMARPDGPGGVPRIAAAAALARGLDQRQQADPLLAVEWRAIGGVDGGGAIDPAALRAGTLSAPGGESPLGDELDRAVAERRPDLLLVVTDGRVTAGSSLAATAGHWQARDLDVFTLATGTAAVSPELAIDEVVINRDAAKDEREPVTVRLSARALPAGTAPIVTVAIPGADPVTVKAVPVPGPADGGDDPARQQALEAHLEVTFTHEGPATVRITATVAGAAAGATVALPAPAPTPALSAAPQDIAVQVHDRRLTVLMLAQRPRFEERYLREALKRDRTMTLHAYLADGRWRRWGTEGPDVLPLSPEALAAYDVIIIGDIGPEALPEGDLQHLDQALRRSGAGLLWIPGETGAIAGFGTGAMAEDLPVTLPDAATIAAGYLDGRAHRLRRAPGVERLGLLEPAAGDIDWPQLPSLDGALPLSAAAVRPGSEVLAEDQDANPLVITRACGAGRCVLVAVDDTWRWRRNAGDHYLHRFHSQLLRFAASGRRGGNRPWRVTVSPHRALPGETIELGLMPLGQPEGAGSHVAVQLSQGDRHVVVALDPVGAGEGSSAHIGAPGPGRWNVVVVSGVDPTLAEPAELVVVPAEDELRDPRVDLPGLQAFAAASGGQVFTDPAALLAALPKDLRRSDSSEADNPMWDGWTMLLVVVGLFTLEWGLRRTNRLP